MSSSECRLPTGALPGEVRGCSAAAGEEEDKEGEEEEEEGRRGGGGGGRRNNEPVCVTVLHHLFISRDSGLLG